ncbi:MAG: HisA/HisF-related TIM barrel protein [Betaproteobacteria bacterium]
MTGFNLIPVIDLKEGMVVHAREGRREEYRPVDSRLGSGADPLQIVAALLALHPFRCLYAADLDAIQQRGGNMASLQAIHRHFPKLELWVDIGMSDETGLARWLDAGLGRPVIGSESLRDASFVALVRDRCVKPSPVLSLDHVGEDFRGPQVLLTHPERYWPQRVLAMNLQRVGSDRGPDLELIVGLAARVPGCQVYAAGGVRSIADLESIATAGAAGALIASALHDGRIGPADLARIAETIAQRSQ